MKRSGGVRAGLRATARTEAELERLRGAADELRESAGGSRAQGSWRAFENITRVLVESGEPFTLDYIHCA